jgi:hypothetical protein
MATRQLSTMVTAVFKAVISARAGDTTYDITWMDDVRSFISFPPGTNVTQTL